MLTCLLPGIGEIVKAQVKNKFVEDFGPKSRSGPAIVFERAPIPVAHCAAEEPCR